MAKHVDALLARINALEKAQDLFREDIVRVPTVLDRAIMALRELIEARLVTLEHADVAMDEKMEAMFGEVSLRFSERDIRFQQSALDHKEALAAALTAMKENLAQTRLLAETIDKANNTRLNALETAREGIKGERAGSNLAVQWIIGLMAIVLTAVGFLIIHVFRQ